MTQGRRRGARAPIAALAVLLLTAALALTACGSDDKGGDASAATGANASSSSPKPFTLRYGVVSNNGQPEGPIGFAQSHGKLLPALKAAGVTDIKVTIFPNGPNLAAALVSGALDIGDLGDTPALVAGGQGVKAKLLQIYQQDNEAWLIGKKGGATTLAALKGKKVATAPGSYMDRYLKGLVAEEGLSGKVTVGAMLPPAGVAAVQKGALDAYAFPFPIGASLAEKGFPVIDQATKHPGLAGNSVSLITDKALGAHPGLPAAWRAATKAANEAVRANPDAFWAYESKINKVTLDAARTSYPADHYPLEPFPADAVQALQGTLHYLVTSKQAKSFDLKGWEVP